MAPKRSIAWDHFVDKGEYKAQCKLCKVDISFKASVSNLTKHLKRRHGTISLVARENNQTKQQIEQSRPEPVPSTSTTSGGTGSVNVEGTSLSRITRATANITSYLRRDCTKIKKDIDRHIMNLFICDLQPFSIVEDKGFKQLINFAFPNYVIPSRKYFANNLLPSIYEETKLEIRKKIDTEVESICLTTSRVIDWYMAVTCHFIDKNMVLQSILLECSALDGGSHTGTVLAQELRRIVQEWNIEDKILIVISDNGSNIKYAIEKCLGWRHFNCYAHTLNLAVQKALNNEEICSITRKVKAIVSYFKKSTIGWDKWRKYQQQAGKDVKRPLQDVPTRWNSSYYMFERFIQLKEEINSSLSNLNPGLTLLKPQEWIIIEKLLLVLKPCEQVTKEMSGQRYVTGSSVIPITTALKSSLLELIRNDAEPLPDAVENVRTDIYGELVSRFSSLENSRTYTVCMFLDPRYKLYFENEATADNTKKHVIGLVINLIREAETSGTIGSDNPVDQETIEANNEKSSTIWRHYHIKMQSIRSAGSAYSRAVVEVQRYLDDKVISINESPLQWWQQNQNCYPHLTKLSRLKQNALATSVPCERLFSVAGNILSERRTRLGVRKVQQMLFIKENKKII